MVRSCLRVAAPKEAKDKRGSAAECYTKAVCKPVINRGMPVDERDGLKSFVNGSVRRAQRGGGGDVSEREHGAEEACEDEEKGPAAESDEVHEQIRTPRGLDLDVRNMREREEKKRVGGEGKSRDEPLIHRAASAGLVGFTTIFGSAGGGPDVGVETTESAVGGAGGFFLRSAAGLRAPGAAARTDWARAR